MKSEGAASRGTRQNNSAGAVNKARQGVTKGGRGNGGPTVAKVDENQRIRFQTELLAFREDPNATEYRFPPNLSSTERKYVHRMVTEMGLASKSHGQGEARAIVVTKVITLASKELQSGSMTLELSPESLSTLNQPVIEDALASLESLLQETAAVAASGKKSRRQWTRDVSAISVQNPAVQEKLMASYDRSVAALNANPRREVLAKQRSILPAAEYRDVVCDLVKKNPVVLVSGETGCGKSTQVPQFLFEDPEIGRKARIVITQPRRISAISLAERVSYERGENVGTTVGYNIRMESVASADTQIVFVTPGVLLRKLIDDPTLLEFTHVVVDEAHERDQSTEFLLILLRDIISRRNDLRLVLMSATMQTAKLRDYFGAIPQIGMGGSMFPVKEFHLEHVLNFTGYADVLDAAAADRSADTGLLQRRYQCSVCAQNGFASVEELGTHAATCYPKERGFKVGPVNHQASLRDLQRKIDAVRRKVGIEVTAQDEAIEAAAAAALQALDFETLEAEENDQESDSEASLSDHELELNLQTLASEHPVPTEINTYASEESAAFTELLRKYQHAQAEVGELSVDYDLIVSLLRYIFSSEFGRNGGSVLIFLAGWDDISKLHRILTSSPEFSGRNTSVLQLHSGIPRAEQNLVFIPAGPGERKIILSTNIAETSLTIDDITIVIDSGMMKEKVYNPHTKLSYLQSSFISQASARQRKGRAGRTRAGVCFRLYSALRAKHMMEFQESELLRMPLDELVLQTKILGVANGKGDEPDSAKSFLLKAMDPPHTLSIDHGVNLLKAINVLDENEQLTLLGEVVGRLPMNPRMGKMLLVGCLLGCSQPTISLSAVLSYRDPFLLPTSDAQRAKVNLSKERLAAGSRADSIAVLRALEAFNTALGRRGNGEARQLCDRSELSFPTMNYLTQLCSQLEKQVDEAGCNVKSEFCNRQSGDVSLATALLSHGMYPQYAVRARGSKFFTTEKGLKAMLHPSSINANPHYRKECRRDLEMLCFQELIALNVQGVGSASYTMINTTPLSPLMLLLTAGNLVETPIPIDVDDASSVLKSSLNAIITIDNFVSFTIPKSHIALIHRCRALLDSALVQLVKSGSATLSSQKNLRQALDLISRALHKEQDTA